MHRLWIAALLIAATAILQMRLAPAPARAEADLSALECTDVTQSKLLKRLCYDEAHRTMVAEVAGRYYAHCNVDPSVFDGLSDAESVPSYYITEIRAGHKCKAGDLAPEIAKVIAQ
ncbi:MAG: KTSC domain-containing protein [Pseudolabrys sp.]